MSKQPSALDPDLHVRLERARGGGDGVRAGEGDGHVRSDDRASLRDADRRRPRRDRRTPGRARHAGRSWKPVGALSSVDQEGITPGSGGRDARPGEVTAAWRYRFVKRAVSQNSHPSPSATSEPVSVRTLTAPTRSEIEALAELFDKYRAHYGEASYPAQAIRWLGTEPQHPPTRVRRRRQGEVRRLRDHDGSTGILAARPLLADQRPFRPADAPSSWSRSCPSQLRPSGCDRVGRTPPSRADRGR